MTQLKPALSYEEQIDRLKNTHNLLIPDNAVALDILKKVNYYRLSAYRLGLMQKNDKEKYVDGISLDCVDFENEIFTISRTVAKVMKPVMKDKTKNQSSRRPFPMTPDIKKLLLDMKNQQEADRAFYGKAYYQSNFVFRWSDGRPFSPDYVSQKFPLLLKAAGLPHIRFHELRHSSASNLLNMGFSLKDVQEWLGHSDIKTTANVYGHLDAKRKISMAKALDFGA